MRPAPPEALEVAPYSTLAAIYDHVMRHVDYVAWCDYVERIWRRFGARPQTVLDLACGTGTLALELARRGYQLTGADGAGAMLDEARRKAARAEGGRQVVWRRADLEAPGGIGRFDAVLCLYDSLNYLTSAEALRAALGEMLRLTAPEGLVILDVCTVRNSLVHFDGRSDRDEGGGFTYERCSRFDRTSSLQYNTFTIRVGDERRVRERHVQRIYHLDEIKAQIAALPCTLEGAFGDFSFRSASEGAHRVHYVLRSKDREPC